LEEVPVGVVDGSVSVVVWSMGVVVDVAEADVVEIIWGVVEFNEVDVVEEEGDEVDELDVVDEATEDEDEAILLFVLSTI
jgi:hypothetical protein